MNVIIINKIKFMKMYMKIFLIDSKIVNEYFNYIICVNNLISVFH